MSLCASSLSQIVINEKAFFVPAPFSDPVPEVLGREGASELMFSALHDPLAPQHVLLHGPPGVGKTSLALQACRMMAGSGPIYLFQAHSAVHPEDISVTPRPSDLDIRRIDFILSPIAAAVASDEPACLIIDEALVMPAKAWHPLLSLLDFRRTLTSILGGFSLKAERGIRVVACGTSSSGLLDLPDCVSERFPVKICLDVPERSVLDRIVEERIDKSLARQFLRLFWHSWSGKDLPSPRRLLNCAFLAIRLAGRMPQGNITRKIIEEVLLAIP